MRLNARAAAFVERSRADLEGLGAAERTLDGGTRVLDLGIDAPGGLDAGRLLARASLADLARVDLVPGGRDQPWPRVVVSTDHPVAACLAAQYAGWKISVNDWFAMGSGPFRALYGGEELYDRIGWREEDEVAVGALETRSFPTPEVARWIAERVGLPPDALILLVAPTASLAGSLQVVARSVETALHKLDALGCRLDGVASAFGSAPLPPPGRDDLEAIGRTNDAVLYGSSVTLWMRGDDEVLEEIARKVPCCTSREWGRTFLEIFEACGGDFYAIDPLLFSPAEVTLVNIASGRSFTSGSPAPDVLRRSFVGS